LETGYLSESGTRARLKLGQTHDGLVPDGADVVVDRALGKREKVRMCVRERERERERERGERE
jgi:hypothetical protein